MRVIRGGSAEVSGNRWEKFDIELDESDIQRLLINNGISDRELTVGEAFQLLEAEAELLVQLKFQSLGMVVPEGVITQANNKVSRIIERIKG